MCDISKKHMGNEMNKITKGILLCFFIFSQNSYAADECKDILSNGIWEYKSTQNINEQTSSFLTWFCSKTFKSEKEAHDAKASIGIPIEDLPIQLSGGYKKENWSDYRNEMCSLSAGSYKHLDEFKSFAKTASESITNAWEKCMSCSALSGWLANTQDPNTFSLNVKYRAAIGSSNFIFDKISFQPSKLKCNPALSSFSGRQFQNSATSLCTRNKIEDDVTIQPIIKDATDPIPPLSIKGYKPLPPEVKLLHSWIDEANGLMWQNMSNEHDIKQYDARTYCQDLNHNNNNNDGFTDWRLPTSADFASTFASAQVNATLIKRGCSNFWTDTNGVYRDFGKHKDDGLTTPEEVKPPDPEAKQCFRALCVRDIKNPH